MNKIGISHTEERGTHRQDQRVCASPSTAPPHPIPSVLPLHLLCLHLSKDGVSRRIGGHDLSLLQSLTVTFFTGCQLLGHRQDIAVFLEAAGGDGVGDRIFEGDTRLACNISSG
ncbi:hypothetical protein E2C01_037675 [Portunus trituberculatus]|uniref:Uncharacterized protein n=1 Tax=Portunus trituberculatus TaxID=210409 RepID=A0A5B7FF82_PORTR|nr:hypothetical protein [Portunus trituberculatus]